MPGSKRRREDGDERALPDAPRLCWLNARPARFEPRRWSQAELGAIAVRAVRAVCLNLLRSLLDDSQLTRTQVGACLRAAIARDDLLAARLCVRGGARVDDEAAAGARGAVAEYLEVVRRLIEVERERERERENGDGSPRQ